MSSDRYYEGEPLRIGNETQLLVDGLMVEDRWKLRREVCLPEKSFLNPVLVQDKPWEGEYLSAPVVFRDEEYGKYRMWYGVIRNADYIGTSLPRKYFCYAESDDGFNWEKPLLDVYPPEKDMGRTNIVYKGSFPEDPSGYGIAGTQVFKDKDDPDPDRRYKMIGHQARMYGKEMRRGVSLAVSPDGFKWTLSGDDHILDYQSDTMNHVVYNPVTEMWHLYCRPRCTHAAGLSPHDPVPEFYPRGRHRSRRFAVMTSKDFVNWSYPRTCLYPDELSDPDYDACAVYRFGSHFIMFYVSFRGDTDGTKEVHIASSGDGFHWNRLPIRAPIIPQGREGDWDAGQIMRVSTGGAVTQGNNFLLYYLGTPKGQYDFTGRGGVGITVAKKDRFVMQHADDEPGYLISREFVLEGNRLRVNTSFNKIDLVDHYIKAEILSHPGLGNHGKLMDPKRGRFSRLNAAHDGYSLAESDPQAVNGTDVLMTWNGNADLGPLMGKPVYVRFELRNMGIFSFTTTKE